MNSANGDTCLANSIPLLNIINKQFDIFSFHPSVYMCVCVQSQSRYYYTFYLYKQFSSFKKKITIIILVASPSSRKYYIIYYPLWWLLSQFRLRKVHTIHSHKTRKTKNEQVYKLIFYHASCLYTSREAKNIQRLIFYWLCVCV